MFIYLIKLAIIISITYAESEVYVRNQNDEIIAIFNSIPTQFGTLVPNNLIGRAIMANPKNACKRIKPPPYYLNEIDYQWFVVIR